MTASLFRISKLVSKLALISNIIRHPGTVKYVGPVHYAAGTYVGVEMDQTSVGKNNGNTLKKNCLS